MHKAFFNRQSGRQIVHCAACATALFCGAADAARPFVTDDARIVDDGGYQIETFVKRQHTFSEREFWFLPAHNPGGRFEFTAGGIWTDSALEGNSRALLVQVKTLLKKLDTNGSGYALTLGALRQGSATNPYLNGIASFSFAGDRAVIHSNLGARRSEEGATRGTWGVGTELALGARLFAIAEMFGERRESPTRHVGLRYWLVRNRVQLDGTLGQQYGDPERRFHSIGLRLLF